MKNFLKHWIGFSRLLISSCIFFPISISADCSSLCPPHLPENEQTWSGALRLKALKNLDQILYLGTSEKTRTYPLAQPLQEKWIEVDIPEVREFVEKYGYFSLNRPIVSKVTSDPEDLELTCCLLKTLYEKGVKGDYLQIAVAEILTKILAYRDLKIGQKISIPIESQGTVAFESFLVDAVFDIWHGMPAFGLIPEKQSLASILLFRGTDFSFDSQRGWASLISDLDIAGPGLHAFHKAQDALSTWLKKTKKMGKASQVMGCSLGGALAAYTFIYENASLAEKGSIAVCPPGVSQKVIEDWQLLQGNRRLGLTSYVYTGDIVSKVGTLFGTGYCLTSLHRLKPLTAHTFLMCSQPRFSKALLDVEFSENSTKP